MSFMKKINFPTLSYYDQDFMNVYNRFWIMMQEYIKSPKKKLGFTSNFLSGKDEDYIEQMEAIFTAFYTLYSNRSYPVYEQLDNFYKKQESDGAICRRYSLKDGKPLFTEKDDYVSMPVFSWAEYNIFYRIGERKRLFKIYDALVKYSLWIENNFFDAECGLFKTKLSSTYTDINSLRKDYGYFVDFNSAVALNYYYMTKISDVINRKDDTLEYHKKYYSLKIAMNKHMWDDEGEFYFDLNEDKSFNKLYTLTSYWVLVAEIPNTDRKEKMVNKLRDKNHFATPNPIPSISVSEKEFSKNGNGYRGSVISYLNFVVVKGLERYQEYELARSISIKHLYTIINVILPEKAKSSKIHSIYNAYKPFSDMKAAYKDNDDNLSKKFPSKHGLLEVSLIVISLMMENIIGFDISSYKKMIYWNVPEMDEMGIENMDLKRNVVSISSFHRENDWEIRLEGEKLYYFNINLLKENKIKQLPIPSGKCSLFLDKVNEIKFTKKEGYI